MNRFVEAQITAFHGLADQVEIKLHVDQRQVVLQAGEVHENLDGQLTIVRPDESILVAVESAPPPFPE